MERGIVVVGWFKSEQVAFSENIALYYRNPFLLSNEIVLSRLYILSISRSLADKIYPKRSLFLQCLL